MYFYSLNTRGFYSSDIHGEAIPDDAVEVTAERYAELLGALAAGSVVKLSEDGQLVTADPVLTNEQLVSLQRMQRDAALDETDWLIVRHRDEADIGLETTLSVEQFKALISYRQALRELPEQEGFPTVEMPVAPDFVALKQG